MNRPGIPTAQQPHGAAAIRPTAQPADGPETCCVALRAQVTQDQPVHDVEILLDLPRVEFGEPSTTLRKLIRYRLDEPVAAPVLAELEGLGPLDATSPMLLERLHNGDDGVCVHLEAKVLPVSLEQRRELHELLAGVTDARAWHEDAWAWVEIVEECRRAATPDGRLPVHYLEDALTERAAPVADIDVPTIPASALAPGS